MRKIDFHRNEYPTIGVELELGLVDGETMAFSSSIKEVLDLLPNREPRCFKPELMQCCIEINTGICRTVAEADADLRQKLAMVEQATDSLGLRLWWGATHPFSLWGDQQITPN